MIELNKIYNEDCLEGMKRIPDGSVDCIVCDLPYGTTACAWDSVLPFDKLWEQYKRIIKNSGAIVLFSQQPFTSALIMSNIDMYKYNWIWKKESGTNYLNSHHQPLKITEDICVFGMAATTESKKKMYMEYHPQMIKGCKPYACKNGIQRKDAAMVRGKCQAQNGGAVTVSDGSRFPINLLEFIRDKEKIHPHPKASSSYSVSHPHLLQRGRHHLRQLYGQRHHRHCSHPREAQLHRLRAQQGVLRQGLQAHQAGTGAADSLLTTQPTTTQK